MIILVIHDSTHRVLTRVVRLIANIFKLVSYRHVEHDALICAEGVVHGVVYRKARCAYVGNVLFDDVQWYGTVSVVVVAHIDDFKHVARKYDSFLNEWRLLKDFQVRLYFLLAPIVLIVLIGVGDAMSSDVGISFSLLVLLVVNEVDFPIVESVTFEVPVFKDFSCVLESLFGNDVLAVDVDLHFEISFEGQVVECRVIES